jgi:hypothetical protein
LKPAAPQTTENKERLKPVMMLTSFQLNWWHQSGKIKKTDKNDALAIA